MRSKPSLSVSIISANYNNGKYLTDFIQSVENSTVLPLELILIDDGSKDNSLEILDGFSHLKYLTIIKFEKNQGLCAALNAGIEKASGDFCLRVDPDDILMEDRIEKQVAFLEKNIDVSVVGSNVIYFHDSTKQELFRSNFPLDHSAIQMAYLKGEHGVQHPSTMIRTQVLKKYRYNIKHHKVEDYDLFARIIKDGYRFANFSEPLLRMRVHSQSVSSNIKYDTIRRTFKIRDRIFNTYSNSIHIRFYYWYILNYKRFFNTQNRMLKYIFLSLAVLALSKQSIQ